mgnify:FL=1
MVICKLSIQGGILMYQSPFSPNEIKYFMDLMQNDTTEGKGATYAKLEVLLSNTKHAQRFTRSQLKSIKGGML